MRYVKVRLVLICITISHFSQADISMPCIFSSNMVLQRDIEIPVWGWSSPGERINISLGEQKLRTKADDNGMWVVKLLPMSAGGPFEFIIMGKNEIRFTNVMIGDVWICSGQSNMEWSVARSDNPEEEIKNANYPDIRLYTVPKKMDKYPQENTEQAEWIICSPDNIAPFSAVAYFFGRQLNMDLGIPIGLINTSWGGTVVETWISAQSVREDGDLGQLLTELENLDVDNREEQMKKELGEWQESFRQLDAGYKNGVYVWAAADMIYSEWPEMELPALWEDRGLDGLDGVVWFSKEIQLNKETTKSGFNLNLGPIDDSDIVWVNGNKVGETFNIYNRNRNYRIDPDVLIQGINVITVRVEDYRGGGGIYGDSGQMFIETNGDKQPLTGKWRFKVGADTIPANFPVSNLGPNSYPTLLYNAMVHPLIPYGIKGAIWYQGESNAGRAYQYRRIFPLLITDWREHWDQGEFPFLFVQLANFMQPKNPPAESEWAELREAQTMTLALPKTGMATIIDIGEATDIHPRNKQDVGSRLALSAYKVAYGKDVVYTGPTFESMQIEEDNVFITLRDIGSGIDVKDLYGYINGFTIAGSDKVFHWAKAELIDDHTIKVYSKDVPVPVAVRYGWADNPHDLNLYNKEGLPANPFRTDDWDGITKGKK